MKVTVPTGALWQQSLLNHQALRQNLPFYSLSGLLNICGWTSLPFTPLVRLVWLTEAFLARVVHVLWEVPLQQLWLWVCSIPVQNPGPRG